MTTGASSTALFSTFGHGSRQRFAKTWPGRGSARPWRAGPVPGSRGFRLARHGASAAWNVLPMDKEGESLKVKATVARDETVG